MCVPLFRIFRNTRPTSSTIIDDEIDYNKAIKFIPPITNGYVVKVYDGDTITIVSKLPFNESPLYKWSVRLYGIDCPEIKGKNEEEKEIAQIAKKEVEKLCLNKNIKLENVNLDKYGRILANVLIDDINISNFLINKKLAVSYDGGTKISPDNWKNYYNS